MLAVLTMLRLSARDVMGYTLIVLFVLTSVVFLLVTRLGMTLRYPLSRRQPGRLQWFDSIQRRS